MKKDDSSWMIIPFIPFLMKGITRNMKILIGVEEAGEENRR